MNPELSSLPIFPYLDQICDTLKSSESRFLVLTAETAAGKSTAVPLALLEHFDGKLLMLEPRRLAASAIADRLSYLLGEETGKTVGYRLHLESKVSKETRLEVITEAILTRRFQADPLLEDVNVIVLDEFHERSIHSDLALAFLKETMQLRDDLYVIVMSATINYRTIAEYLGTKEKPAPVMQIPGRQFPVDIEYKAGVTVAQAVFEELKAPGQNSILAFLPGIYEIRKTKRELEELLTSVSLNTEILILHSSVPVYEQRKVLAPPENPAVRRVILSSAIAETSLTVPGVTTVIDSGLSRKIKMNVALGMEHLVTEKESLFSAEQRSGRAGRIARGKCIRLWDKNEPRQEQNQCEIQCTDLTQLVLECAQWGADTISKLNWLTPPPESAWNQAKNLLEMLGCIEISRKENNESIKITEKGRACLKLPLHPRLACVALEGRAETLLPFTEYADSNPERQKLFLNDLQRRLNKIKIHENGMKSAGKSSPTDSLLFGFPDRLARFTGSTDEKAEKAEYQFPSGRCAWLKKEELISTLKRSDFPQWIVAPEVDAGETAGKIYSFEVISNETVQHFLGEHSKVQIKTSFTGTDCDFKKLSIQKKEITSFGKIILKEKNLPSSNEDFSLALCGLIMNQGLSVLPLDSKIEDLILRTTFLIQNDNEDKSELEEKLNNLSSTANQWLLPFVQSQNISSKVVFDALYWYLDGSQTDSKVPLQITLANRRKRKVKYEKKADGRIQPSLEIIIQQIFGCFETPKILGKPILLKLLSPASRPLQITDDLEHFWTGAWIEICKEMKGRYPKHNWDYRKNEE